MTTTNATINKVALQQKEITRIFKLQQLNQAKVAATSSKERIAKLKKLQAAILMRKGEMQEALYKDFQKHSSEVDLTEILPINTDIKHTISHIKQWMRPKKVDTPITLMGASSHVRFEAKGVVLIISPWNFPFNLTFCPLISAIAAGNCVILKPSEHTPHSSAVMKNIISDLFEENEIALFEGDHTVSAGLLKLPFNHIFFTGSPQIGKIVMRAAADHLASVTLELGGKSPVIVDESANLKETAKKVAWAKYMNNGQICIAPDYLFVHESKKAEFLKLMEESVSKMYGANAEERKKSTSYTRMVNNRHFERVKNLIEDAVEKGATVQYGAEFDASEKYIAPTLLTNIHPDSSIMKEEIFGPALPVFGYTDLDEVLHKINEKERPLAFYIFSNKRKNIQKMLDQSRAGGTCINDCVLHFFNSELPFGGVNNSGIGKSHGEYGFKAFSNERAVLKQNVRFGANQLMYPPYTKTVQRLIDLTMKWF